MTAFFALVFALSVPCWLLGAITEHGLFPGVPVSALMVFAPGLAASILVYRREGAIAAAALLRRIVDYRRITPTTWYLPILILMPSAMLLTYELTRMLGVDIQTDTVTVAGATRLLGIFFIAAMGEELGWSAYAIEVLQRRLSALAASLMLGIVWAGWHLVPLLQAGRAPDWIAWWCLYAVALRVLHTWLYNNTNRSVFGAALFHAVCNTSWQLFPIAGSHWDPRIGAPIVAGIAAVVAIIWGPRTLSRFKNP